MTIRPRTEPVTPIERFTADVAALLDRIARVNAVPIARAAEAMLATLRTDGLVHVGGAGHGLMLGLEAFYRAGGLACVDPVWRPALLPLAGARASTQAERSSGLGSTLADEAGIAEGDCVVIASQSGLNPVSIDLAAAAGARGATVIAVTSVAHGRSLPSRDLAGRRLLDIAAIVIDTCVPPGDAAWDPADPRTTGAPEIAGTPQAGGGPDTARGGAIGMDAAGDIAGATPRRRIAPLSTIASCHAWNLVLVTLAGLARTRDVELPIWVSSNVPGGDEANAVLLARYGDRVAAL